MTPAQIVPNKFTLTNTFVNQPAFPQKDSVNESNCSRLALQAPLCNILRPLGALSSSWVTGTGPIREEIFFLKLSGEQIYGPYGQELALKKKRRDCIIYLLFCLK